jgi:pyrroline-5-carboxylate reductase
MPEKSKIALIGCGKMGGALLRGWIQAGILNHAYVLDPAGMPDDIDARLATAYKDSPSFIQAKPQAGIYVLAVKPQVMEETCRALAGAVPAKALVLSIAAGQKISSFEKYFDAAQPVVRAMPNLPASIGLGITVAVANSPVSAAQKQQADSILRAAGAVEWIDDENMLDAVTALSGSGPAYVFLLIEALARAGEKQGLTAALAKTLARQTVIGSAALAEREATTPPETLRKNVTSPGGTTEAALKILMDDGKLQNLFDRALAAATARGRELSQ